LHRTDVAADGRRVQRLGRVVGTAVVADRPDVADLALDEVEAVDFGQRSTDGVAPVEVVSVSANGSKGRSSLLNMGSPFLFQC
jgi:hypothetical protein